MANTIQTAVRYLNNDVELQNIFKTRSFTSDWIKPNVAIGAKTVKYRQVTFGSTVLGTFNRETGYTKTDINVSWAERELTQDKGNSLMLDKMDGEEAQSLEIATVGNKYLQSVVAPAVDTYNLAAVAEASGVEGATGNISASNIEAAIDAGLDHLYSVGATEGVALYIKSSAARLLKNAAKSSGSISLGNWNGEYGTEVKVYGDTIKAKVVEIPDALFPSGVAFFLLPVAAVTFIVKYRDNEYFDKVPGFGSRRQQLDIGVYYDCWVEPGAEEAIYVHAGTVS